VAPLLFCQASRPATLGNPGTDISGGWTMAAVAVGVVKESAAGERRVAVVPEVVPKLSAIGLDILVETDAGAAAWFADSAYSQAGAAIVPAVDGRAGIVVCVGPPPPERIAGLAAGTLLIGLLNPVGNPELVAACAAAGVTAVSLELLPRTLSRAQSMDALSSQANIAGYKSVLVAAEAYGRYFPMLMTAAGTAKPAQILILGVGVAGLSAIGTARRLGAQVTAYDIRPETREEVRSVGGRFLDLPGVSSGRGEGGYARALTDDERTAQQAAVQERIGDFDIVITTALVPGRRPPQLVTQEAIKGMKAGSVVVDVASGPLGGNVEGSQLDTTVVVADGVTVIGAGNLPSAMAPGASSAYARNITAVVTQFVRDGAAVVDLADEIQAAIVLTHDGAVVNPIVGGTAP
jgi:NAD(P) transhydrogenase subunit alpha